MTAQESPKTQAKTSAQGNGTTGEGDKLCPVHKVALRRFEKGERAWYSHKLADDGTWCHGKGS